MKTTMLLLLLCVTSCYSTKDNYVFKFNSTSDKVQHLPLTLSNEQGEVLLNKRTIVFRNSNTLVFNGKKLDKGVYYLQMDTLLNEKIIKQ